MEINTIENILNSMLQTLDEFKSEDIKYYRKQTFKIINHIKNQNRSIQTLSIDLKTKDYHIDDLLKTIDKK
tara:strand:+ start:19 stop:231 length:213 start_codon:yes stop_codon:yes gene_type:complete